MLVTENSTQSSEPLIEGSSPPTHYSQEDDTHTAFHRTDQNYAFKHESLEDNESTDDGGFKVNDASNVIRQIKDTNNTSNNDAAQNAFYRFPEGDFVSASDV